MTRRERVTKTILWALMGVLTVVTVARFASGLGAVTNLSDAAPWGLWIAFDVMAGVALAAGGFTLAATVYIFRLERYRRFTRPAILTAFLGYTAVAVGLLYDLGLPWHIWHPIVYPQPHSVLFEVAMCVMLYLTVLALEFSPVVLEHPWFDRPLFRAAHHLLKKATIPLVIAGIMLSTLHQSSLGALFLLTPTKLHPLWYSSFIPLYFFVSSIAAGLGMVVLESAMSHRLFRDRLDPQRHVDLDALTLGLSRGASVVLFTYVFLKLQGLADSGDWTYLGSGWGAWYALEVGGLALVPCFLFAHAARTADVRLARIAAGLTVAGVVLNRLNVSIFAMNWQAPVRYVPSAMEVLTSLCIITLGVLTFRWIVNRMPVLAEHPDYPDVH